MASLICWRCWHDLSLVPTGNLRTSGRHGSAAGKPTVYCHRSNPGDLVLDPFNGIGSTGYQSVKMGRRYIGVELKPEYARQAARFLEQAEGQSTALFDVAELAHA